MNLKNYLTASQVKAGATTPRKALELSIKHWYQNTLLTEKQLQVLWSRSIDVARGSLCGLCVFNGNCDNCILDSEEQRCGFFNTIYYNCDNALDIYRTDPTIKNFLLWQDAAKAMHKLLCSLRGK